MKTAPILEANNLHKTFYYPKKIEILKGIDLSLYQGESCAIVGRSGQGKSTLLQILGTLDQPCKGVLRINNEEVNTFSKPKIRNQSIGFIFQSFHLLEDYTALQNVLMPAYIARQNISEGGPFYNKAVELLKQVELGNRISHDVKLLSGGEKQRVAIARAMINDPKILFADEPSGNLDSHTSAKIHDLLIDLNRSHGKTIVIVTHDYTLAKLCTHHCALNEGYLERITL